MTSDTNAFGQPLGAPLSGWTPRQPPPATAMGGRVVRLEPLDPFRHGADLGRAFMDETPDASWTYLGYGPFGTPAELLDWLGGAASTRDPQFFAVLDGDDSAVGVASFLRIQPDMGVLELGHLHFTPRLQRTRAATEAVFVMLRRAFDELGYRRCEWKCDALNARSRGAADRLGFTFEGVFRNACVTKHRNRDTAWYAIIDTDWPPLRARFERWLDDENFDEEGQQRRRLQEA